MDRNKNRQRDSIKKSRKSSSNSTYCKPIKNSTHCYDSSDAEIEFEGWIEFVTKKDKNSNNGSSEKKKKLNSNNNKNELYLKRKSEKINASFKKANSKNSAYANATNSECSYASTNIIYKNPESLLNNNMAHQVNNGQNAFFINQQEIRENPNNILNPIHAHSATPIILKNQQNLPQLYLRQPPTVIVSNEQRPPLVINPPPANVIFENQSPQPIYVNSARPNIIIKNDPPILKNPTNINAIPIQVSNPVENDSFRTNFINVPSSIELNGATIAANTCHLNGNVKTFGTALPTNFIQLDNNLAEIPHQMMTNDYIVKDNQYGNIFQTQNDFSIINPNNNVVHAQHNPEINECGANVIQNIGTPFTQMFAQHNNNTCLLNKQAIENPIMQVVSPSPAQFIIPEQGKLDPQFYNLQTYANAHPQMAYEQSYSPSIAQNTIEKFSPQVIHQNHIQSAAGIPVPENLQIAASVQNQVLYPPNVTSQKPNIFQYQKGIPHQFNHHKQMVHPSYTPNHVLPTYPLSCIPKSKYAHTFPLKKNMYINSSFNDTYNTPKKVQVITTPIHNKGFKGYNVAQ